MLTVNREPGKGRRKVIDTKYAVRAPGGAVLARFGNSRDADTFVAGWKACEAGRADSAAEAQELYEACAAAVPALEVGLDLRDVPDEVFSALDRAARFAVRYGAREGGVSNAV